MLFSEAESKCLKIFYLPYDFLCLCPTIFCFPIGKLYPSQATLTTINSLGLRAKCLITPAIHDGLQTNLAWIEPLGSNQIKCFNKEHVIILLALLPISMHNLSSYSSFKLTFLPTFFSKAIHLSQILVKKTAKKNKPKI